MAINTEYTRDNVLKDCTTWPAAARARWLALFDPEDRTRVTRWAAMRRSPWVRQTQYQRARVYTWYLASVRRRGLAEQVTPAGVLAFLEDCEAGCRTVTLAGYVKDLKAMAVLLEPHRKDACGWLSDIHLDLVDDADLEPKRKTANLIRYTAGDLYRTGADLVEAALENPETDWPATQMMRDGLYIMLGVMCPERPRAWINLTVDAVKLDARRIEFPGRDVKTKDDSDRDLPELETLLCQVWLDRYRAAHTPDHDRFWIAKGGRPAVATTMAAAVKRRTLEALGVAVSPQRFRDAAATFVVEQMPERARLATTLLRHTSEAMTRNYTRSARQLAASLQSQDHLEAAHRETERKVQALKRAS